MGFSTDGPGLDQSQEIHGFLLAAGVHGRFTRIDVPGAPATGATGINDRGQIVGLYANPAATPGPQPTRRSDVDGAAVHGWATEIGRQACSPTPARPL